MISEDSASPFFVFSCGLAAVVLAHHPLRPEHWNVGRPRKPGAASWVCFLVVPTSPTILEGVVFSGVNLMALDHHPAIISKELYDRAQVLRPHASSEKKISIHTPCAARCSVAATVIL